MQDRLSPAVMTMHSNLAYLNAMAVEALPHWWQKIDNDPKWQEYSFVGLSAAYGLIALVALVQLVRHQLEQNLNWLKNVCFPVGTIHSWPS